MVKTCKRCGETKPHEEYSPKNCVQLKSGKTTVYKSSYCKACQALYGRESAQKKPWYRLSVLYKLSPEDAQHLYQRTGVSCDICGAEWQEGSPRLCVDHNHNTGEVRGILCKPCNHVLGHSYDNIETLQNAILYLKRTGG